MKVMSTKFSIMQRIASIAVLASFLLTNAFAVGTFRNDTIRVVSNSLATAKYTTDLTQLGRQGRLREDLSFEKETIRLIKVLGEGGLRQPVIVDEDAGVQNIIVEQVALRIAKGLIPAQLAGRSIVKIETAALFSNMHSQAEAAQVIDSIVYDAILSKGQTILFVDELTNMVGSRAASTKLLDSIAAGKLVIIGGSSSAAYDERIQSQPEIAAYFAGILVADRANASAVAENNSTKDESEFDGDNVSPDLRDMMAADPSGQTRHDVILQARDADSASLRAMLAEGDARIVNRIGETDTLVVNLPLASLERLADSGTIRYVSPDREVEGFGFVEQPSVLIKATAAVRSAVSPA
jgi:hypothetical protein